MGVAGVGRTVLGVGCIMGMSTFTSWVATNAAIGCRTWETQREDTCVPFTDYLTAALEGLRDLLVPPAEAGDLPRDRRDRDRRISQDWEVRREQRRTEAHREERRRVWAHQREELDGLARFLRNQEIKERLRHGD